MGRRWWQKEARRQQNEKAPVNTSEPDVEEVLDAPAHIEDAAAAVDELVAVTETITTDDVADVVLTPEEAAIEDAKDAAVPVPIKVEQNKFSISNKKKRR